MRPPHTSHRILFVWMHVLCLCTYTPTSPLPKPIPIHKAAILGAQFCYLAWHGEQPIIRPHVMSNIQTNIMRESYKSCEHAWEFTVHFAFEQYTVSASDSNPRLLQGTEAPYDAKHHRLALLLRQTAELWPADVQADEENQLPGGSSTQQSVAMSSQRTAQYHWGNTPHPLIQQHRQLPVLPHDSSQLEVSTAGQEADSSASALGGQFSGHIGSARGAQQQQQQQQQQQSGYAQQQQQQQQEHRGYAQQQQRQSDRASLQRPRPPPSTSGVSTWSVSEFRMQTLV